MCAQETLYLHVHQVQRKVWPKFKHNERNLVLHSAGVHATAKHDTMKKSCEAMSALLWRSYNIGLMPHLAREVRLLNKAIAPQQDHVAGGFARQNDDHIPGHQAS